MKPFKPFQTLENLSKPFQTVKNLSSEKNLETFQGATPLGGRGIWQGPWGKHLHSRIPPESRQNVFQRRLFFFWSPESEREEYRKTMHRNDTRTTWLCGGWSARFAGHRESASCYTLSSTHSTHSTHSMSGRVG